jgi:beta-galactosidase
MLRSSWNRGWEFRHKTSRFLELAGQANPWSPVDVPHDAMITEARSPDRATAATGFHHGGNYEYRKHLDAPDDRRGKRVFLEFEGVYRGASVFVNGQLAARRPYGYSQFTVDVDPYLHDEAPNEIRVEARADADTRWYSGAGIYRDVWLVVGNAIHVALDGVRVSTPDIDDERAVVAVETVVVNDTSETVTVDVTTEIVDASGEVVGRDVVPLPLLPNQPATGRSRICVANPKRWSVDRPYLYECRTTVRVGSDEPVDEAATTFGIRSLSVDPVHGLRINGEPVNLRGACIHHDNGVIGAATFARADARRAGILKAAGFNAIRSAHNPISRALLDACDRIGLLVMDEAFDMWTVPKSDDDYAGSFPDWWEADVAAMIEKDFNHPSVAMYSIGNEIMEIGTPSGAVWSRRLADTIRQRDHTRFVTNGVNALFAVMDDIGSLFSAAGADVDTEAGVNTQMTQAFDRMAVAMRSDLVDQRTAAAFAALDIAGYNYLESRYDIDHERHPNRVIVGTETHPQSIDTNWQYVESHGHVVGDFTWTGWDYLGEAGIGRVVWPGEGTDDLLSGFLGTYPWLIAWCGDIDITGHRRPVSYYREIVFGLRADPYIAVERPGHVGETPTFRGPWSWSDTVSSWTWTGHEGEPVRVEVYAGADEIELTVNGRSVGRAPAGAAHRYVAAFETTYEPGEIVAVASRNGAEAGRTALRTATGDVLLHVHCEQRDVAADGRDVAYVDVALVDGNGALYNTADRKVSVELDGPGVLQGFGSANPKTEERFSDPVHTTFDGRALAVIRPTGAGTITAHVSADGGPTQTVEITAG